MAPKQRKVTHQAETEFPEETIIPLNSVSYLTDSHHKDGNLDSLKKKELNEANLGDELISRSSGSFIFFQSV